MMMKQDNHKKQSKVIEKGMNIVASIRLSKGKK